MSAKSTSSAAVIDDEPFLPATVIVISARRINVTSKTWHILEHEVIQKRPNWSVVTLDEGKRVDSAQSSVKAASAILATAKKLKTMAVVPPFEGARSFVAICPTHGQIRVNSTLEYAAESAYWHALEHKPR